MLFNNLIFMYLMSLLFIQIMFLWYQKKKQLSFFPFIPNPYLSPKNYWLPSGNIAILFQYKHSLSLNS